MRLGVSGLTVDVETRAGGEFPSSALRVSTKLFPETLVSTSFSSSEEIVLYKSGVKRSGKRGELKKQVG